MTEGRSKRRDSQSGLSLIEMLIVLVIIGIATSAAVLSVSSIGRDRRAEEEAARLAAHLNLAVDEGLVSSSRLALFWTSGGYEVKRWTGDSWQAAKTPRLVRAHQLPAALQLRRSDGTTAPVTVAEDGLGPAVDLQISGADQQWVVAFNGYTAIPRQETVP